MVRPARRWPTSRLAITDDGVILGAKLDITCNVGAYLSDPFPGTMMAFAIMAFFQGPMRIEGISSTSTLVFSNKATYVAYRGPWATGDFLRERLLDIVAAEVGVDAVEIRRRNYVVRDEPPLAMLNGKPFVGVTTRECVEQAVDVIGLGRLPRPAGRGTAPRAAISASGSPSYLEGAPGPKGPGDMGDPLGDETAHLARSATTAASSSSPASSPTGRATRPPSPRSPPTSSGCVWRTSRSVGATPTSPRSP